MQLHMDFLRVRPLAPEQVPLQQLLPTSVSGLLPLSVFVIVCFRSVFVIVYNGSSWGDHHQTHFTNASYWRKIENSINFPFLPLRADFFFFFLGGQKVIFSTTTLVVPFTSCQNRTQYISVLICLRVFLMCFILPVIYSCIFSCTLCRKTSD